MTIQQFVHLAVIKGAKSAFGFYWNMEEIETCFARVERPSVLGSAAFIEKIKNLFGSDGEDNEIPEPRILKTSFSDVLAAVC